MSTTTGKKMTKKSNALKVFSNQLKNPFFVLGGLFGLYLVLLVIESLLFSGAFGPFVTIAGVNVGGKSKVGAIKEIQKGWEEYKKKSIVIDEKTYKVADLVSSVDAQKTVEDGINEQTSGHLTFSPLFAKNYSLVVNLNDKKISELLSKEYDKKSKPAKDAEVVLGSPVRIIPEIVGQRLLLAESRENIAAAIGQFQASATLRTEKVQPALSGEAAYNLAGVAKNAASSEITVNAGSRGKYEITPNELVSWVKLKPVSAKSILEREVFLGSVDLKEDFTFFDETKVANWVSDLAGKINIKATNATLGASAGKITVVANSRSGSELDKADAIAKIQQAHSGNRTVELAIAETKPAIDERKLAELGLNELISTGGTNFVGSPKNRLVNIRVGASKFNGVIIKPDEEFSFNKNLGEVEASTGFLPELVIKENKTVPEYGGGLCQVSSTAFRAALNGGLPITERHPHAYPVAYYKPFGVDATIYLPYPDFKFRNDTGHYILIQTRIEGTRLYFDFYGTKAPRTVKFSGNAEAKGAVDLVENVTPYIYDQGVRGKNSFTAVFYRHIYDLSGELTDNDKFTSKYESPDKYPH